MIERQLDCGAKLVAEKLPNFRSVTVGIWVGAGAINETPKENGISHLIEHMLFKGTTNRTALQIAIDADNIGAQLNAFTSKEATCYYIKVIDQKLKEGVDILTDLFCNATLPADELEKEKGVVLEEIAMSNDQPDDVVMDVISEVFFKGTSLSKTILGPPENVERFGREDLLDYMSRYYTGSNVIVAAAGNFDEEELVRLLNEKMAGMNTAPLVMPDFADIRGFAYKPGFGMTPKEIEQVHLCLAVPCAPMRGSNARHALNVLSNIIGGSMSSRLFQRVREQMGMAYSIYSHAMQYKDAGMFYVYAGTMAKNAKTVTELILEELDKVAKNGVTKEEFLQSKELYKGNLVLQMESTSSQMSAIGKGMTLAGEAFTEDEVLAQIDAVTEDEVAAQIEQITARDALSAAYVGDIENPQELQNAVQSFEGTV